MTSKFSGSVWAKRSGIWPRLVVPCVSLGFMFVWGTSLLYWVGIKGEYQFSAMDWIAIAGAALTSASCVAIGLYIAHQDEQIRRHEEWRGRMEAQLDAIDGQLRLLISIADKE